ncbi:histidine kinase [Actinoplanes sp. SE50]|uniref:hypothetical protein n=1 Tax=unclassified Actinoplanes TaxID=2626549 RepID=UPI00023ECCF2|nr:MULTISPECIES: hypothetical protein [unclassified Actinoplanes]AEV85453.1 histidine kinase [Actinoplanes sp. SE50/110]ATO83846.1 histidine kinase [Actinoplanes sp. SE50]SLM01256.1 hypothetical protein ACSP50_4492 [Actinoplanes sp. SE50/110]
MEPQDSPPWERRFEPLVTVVPYGLLAVLAAMTVALGRDVRVDLLLGAGAAVWTLVLFTLRPGWRRRPVIMGVFLAGLILFGLVMVARYPWWGFYTPALYFYAFRIIGWPQEL